MFIEENLLPLQKEILENMEDIIDYIGTLDFKSESL